MAPRTLLAIDSNPSVFMTAIAVLTVTSVVGAQPVPAPKSPTEVVVPASGIAMSPAYARATARSAYIWGWPMVNMLNRSATITKALQPGLLSGTLPVAPRGQLEILRDYIEPAETFVTCPNQDVIYGLSFFSLDEEPVIAQVPDFGNRSCVYALYDARTDQFAELGKPYATKPGFYLLVGPNWKGEKPAGVEAVVRSRTSLANAIPRVVMADTPDDRKAIQTVINQIVFYPLSKFDRKMKTIDWSEAPSIPGPKSDGGGDGRNLYYKDRQYERTRAGGTAEWMQESYLDVNARARDRNILSPLATPTESFWKAPTRTSSACRPEFPQPYSGPSPPITSPTARCPRLINSCPRPTATTIYQRMTTVRSTSGSLRNSPRA